MMMTVNISGGATRGTPKDKCVEIRPNLTILALKMAKVGLYQFFVHFAHFLKNFFVPP